MWANTRMVVLTAFCGAVFAAVLAVFNTIPIIPAIHSLRPGNALPVVFSLLFGPAGTWGAVIGNTLGDFFGILGPGTAFGAFGNFLYSLIPYRLWRRFGDPPLEIRSGRAFLRLLFIVLTSAVACALTITTGVHALALMPVPFGFLFWMIVAQSVGFTLLLGPLLLGAIAPRAHRWGLLYQNLLPQGSIGVRSPLLRRLAVPLLMLSVFGGAIFAFCLLNGWGLPVLPPKQFGAAMAPVILSILLAALWL
jgi:energy-coupling factor transport system substrate-specific component